MSKTKCPLGEDCDLTLAYMMGAEKAKDTIVVLRRENERLRIENIQMQAALGYGILAEDERHILPTNPFKCGTCDARKRALDAVIQTDGDLI